MIQDWQKAITIPAAHYQQTEEGCKNFSSLDDVDPNEKCFWIPAQCNLESFDLLINTTDTPLWCQVTVRKDQSLSANRAKNCLRKVKNSEIVFVLPPDMFQYWFEKQPFKTKRDDIAIAAKFNNPLEKGRIHI